MLAFGVVCVSPGPANLALAARAMAQGRRAALPMAAGLALGLALWGVAAATGLGAVLAGSAAALGALKVVGACYLGWLALGAAQGAARRDGPEAPVAGRMGGFRTGLLLNLSNPKAVLAWMAALSMGLSPEVGAGAVRGATAVCALIGVANYLLWALVFSAGGAMAFYARARRGVEAGCAALFSLAAFGLLRSAFAR
nr:LysE family transporter [Oceaniglobus trochenteri]